MRMLTSALAALVLLVPLAAQAAHQRAPSPTPTAPATRPTPAAHQAPSRTSMRPPQITEASARRNIRAALAADPRTMGYKARITFLDGGLVTSPNPDFRATLAPRPNVRLAPPLAKSVEGHFDAIKGFGGPTGAARTTITTVSY